MNFTNLNNFLIKLVFKKGIHNLKFHVYKS